MNEKLNKLQKAFNKVFENCPTITEATKKEDIASWDSINHLSLILELESEFGIKLSVDEIEGLKSVKQIMEKMS